MRTSKIYRYENLNIVTSPLNHAEDIFGLLSFLKSQDYVIHILKSVHNVATGEAKQRAKRIVAHASYALNYVEMAQDSTDAISFLPSYYAILNFAKISILFGKYWEELDHHAKRHGASYIGQNERHNTLLTDKIEIYTDGVLALYYKTLTDLAIPSRRKISMKEVYCTIPEISVEYMIATDAAPYIANLELMHENTGTNRRFHLHVKTMPQELVTNFNKRWIPVAKNLTKNSQDKYCYTYEIPDYLTENKDIDKYIRDVLDTKYLICSPSGNRISTILRNSNIKFTSEYPIALLFFHMGSVARYNPEFLDRIQQSRQWPMASVARRHAMYAFLRDTWSFINKQDWRLVSSSL